jgi:hypothetical protein
MGDSSVTDDTSEGQQIQSAGLRENRNLMIVGLVVALVIIAVITLVFIQLPSDNGNKKPAAIKNTTTQVIQVSTSNIPKLTKTVRPTGIRTIGQTPTITATPAVPVDFTIHSGTPSSCGLTCRQLDASITNTGFAIAHNVCIDVSMHNSKNEIINLNNEASIQRCIGDIAGGQSKTEPITINADCGAFASKCIGETLTLKTRVTSVEKTVQFPDQVIAV